MKSFEEISAGVLSSLSETDLSDIERRISIERGLLAIAIAVREARTTKGFSQEDLASRAKVTQAEISRIETGRFSPRLETLVKLAQALETSFTIAPATSAA